ncbi:hypothetical protein ACFWP7_28815 [Streptomyces sp. NPDC058470]|uniref:hypothetical protein n=1 Tax=Streptomyces sp. NPDC058470 TaxID=3346515 RepID=UPI00364CE790
MPKAVRYSLSVLYDGTNGEYIAGQWCTGIGFVSDTGTVLTYTDYDGYEQTINVGEWIAIGYPGAGYLEVMTTAQYEERYYELPE